MNEENLQYRINEVNAIMRKMKDDGYRLIVTEGKTKVAWIKVGEADGK